jgi:hypothetical protein
MKQPTNPYQLPGTLAPELARVAAYWRGLLRGSAEIPFWDDLNLGDLPDLSSRMLLIDVFPPPERFRFNLVGVELETLQAKPIMGEFLDEVALNCPLEFLRSQCSATVECGAPTYYKQRAIQNSVRIGYSRLLLPLWRDGRISMLLGAVEWE